MAHQGYAGEAKRRAHQGGYPMQLEILKSDFESNSEYRTTLSAN
jgi:hypothetical protein